MSSQKYKDLNINSSYLFEEKVNIFYKEFNEACIELKELIKNQSEETTLANLIKELENE